MVRIAPVALQNNPRLLWFDPGSLDIHDGDTVIVQTEKGLNFGTAKGILEVDEDSVACLKTKLQPVVRLADNMDKQRIDDLQKRGRDALPIFKAIAAETNEDMHPIMVEFLFEGDRAIFLFEAEERVDFRDLVRRLASEFHVRVDMRQVGVRDEARLVSGLGHCGQELCCHRLGTDFNPVSIRMAKEQGLSLNPQKISGVCGRLMCCLRYEYDAYKEFHDRAPKLNGSIETPHGTAKVVMLDVPREQVTVRVEGENKNITFPLSAMDPLPQDAPDRHPSSIGDAFETYANPDPFATIAAFSSFDTAGFTQDSKLGEAQAHHNHGNGAQKSTHDAVAPENERRKPRHRTYGNKKSKPSQETQPKVKETAHRKRRHRTTTTTKPALEHSRPASNRPSTRGTQHVSKAPKQHPIKQPVLRQRPGQKSSGLAHDKHPVTQNQQTVVTHRKRRRSHHTGGNGAGTERGNNAQ